MPRLSPVMVMGFVCCIFMWMLQSIMAAALTEIPRKAPMPNIRLVAAIPITDKANPIRARGREDGFGFLDIGEGINRIPQYGQK